MKQLALALLAITVAVLVDAQQRRTLHEAALIGDADTIRALIAAGADVMRQTAPAN